MSESKLHYLTGYVAVDRNQVEDAGAVLGQDPVGAEPVLDSASGPPPDDSFQAAVGPIDETLGFFEAEDPRATVNTLRGSGIDASLIHAVGLAPHWSYSPGTKPQPVPAILPDVMPAEEGKVIGVVDTGIVPQGPSWFTDYLHYLPSDEEVFGPNGPQASHGTFIAGLLRQLACNYSVSMARLQFANHEAVVTPDRQPLIADVTTELHLFLSIVRLVQRHGDELAALNLSLDTYTEDDFASMIMSFAIEFWRNNTGDSPIFAAAGNEYEGGNDPYEPFFPAAIEGVIGVAAADVNGVETVWDYHTPPPALPTQEAAPDGPNRRPWVNRAAPGTNLISLGGAASAMNGLSSLVSWSGSSFASPVALAMDLRGVSGDTAHSNVDGLAYMGSSGPTRTPWVNSPCAVPPQGVQQGPS